MLSDEQRRAVVGVMTVATAVAAVWLNWLDPALGDAYPQFASGTVRMAPVLAVVWLAMPEVRRGPGAIIFAVGLVVAIAMLFQSGKTGLRFLLPALGVLFVIGYLRRLTTLLGGSPTNRK